MDIKYKLAENLNREIKKQELSNKVLSELSGVSDVTISQIRNSKANPSMLTVEKLADALEIDTKYLLI